MVEFQLIGTGRKQPQELKTDRKSAGILKTHIHVSVCCEVVKEQGLLCRIKPEQQSGNKVQKRMRKLEKT